MEDESSWSDSLLSGINSLGDSLAPVATVATSYLTAKNSKPRVVVQQQQRGSGFQFKPWMWMAGGGALLLVVVLFVFKKK